MTEHELTKEEAATNLASARARLAALPKHSGATDTAHLVALSDVAAASLAAFKVSIPISAEDVRHLSTTPKAAADFLASATTVLSNCSDGWRDPQSRLGSALHAEAWWWKQISDLHDGERSPASRAWDRASSRILNYMWDLDDWEEGLRTRPRRPHLRITA